MSSDQIFQQVMHVHAMHLAQNYQSIAIRILPLKYEYLFLSCGTLWNGASNYTGMIAWVREYQGGVKEPIESLNTRLNCSP